MNYNIDDNTVTGTSKLVFTDQMREAHRAMNSAARALSFKIAKLKEAFIKDNTFRILPPEIAAFIDDHSDNQQVMNDSMVLMNLLGLLIVKEPPKNDRSDVTIMALRLNQGFIHLATQELTISPLGSQVEETRKINAEIQKYAFKLDNETIRTWLRRQHRLEPERVDQLLEKGANLGAGNAPDKVGEVPTDGSQVGIEPPSASGGEVGGAGPVPISGEDLGTHQQPPSGEKADDSGLR